MSPRALRFWGWTHKWSSLVCTLFMLLLCLTGLPLIFSHEIDELSGRHFAAAPLAEGARPASVDRVVAVAQARHPDLVPLYLFAEEDAPGLWYVKFDTHVASDEKKAVLVAVDGHHGRILGLPDFSRGFMAVMYRLHVDLFAGLAGKLFLGGMGVLLLVSLLSGVVLYAPFMRKLDFGTVRHERRARIRWLDLHNLIGIATLLWALVVGATGVVNTLGDLILKAWQQEQIALLAAGRGTQVLPGDANRRPGANPGSEAQDAGRVQRVIERAQQAAPGMQVDMVAWPGTLLSTPQHFAVILRGDTPLTARLRQALLVAPASGEVLQAAARPWFVTLFQLSQPLHFGDYGGLPLKVLWALLDLLTIVVLGSGVYLWLQPGRRHRQESGG